jgi:hypothetical protein
LKMNWTEFFIIRNRDTLSVWLSVFHQDFKTLNKFWRNFSIADSFLHYYSGIKIILYHFLDIYKNSCFYRLRKTKTFLLNRFLSTTSNSWMCSLAKLILVIWRTECSFSVSTSVAVNRFMRSDGICQIRNSRY